jgi:hypothetical protein
MRARNREVNIFNMSLLDILCGALGAFCFLMLVLFPYWKPAGKRAEDFEKEYQQSARELAALRERIRKLPGPEAQDLEAKLNKLDNLLKKQQGEINNLERRLQQANRESAEQDKQVSNLKMREPLLVSTRFETPGQVADLYVRSMGKSTAGATMPAANPAEKQSAFFSGDQFLQCEGTPCTQVWQIRDVPVGLDFEVYYKYMDDKGKGQPVKITDSYLTNRGVFLALPRIELTTPKTAVLIGVFRADSDTAVSFHPAPEYKQQFDELNKKPDKTGDAGKKAEESKQK